MDNFNIHKFFKNEYLNEGVNDNITKSNISNLDYAAIKYIFPEISNSNRISFPNPDDSLDAVGNESNWEDWKNKIMKRYGDVELEIDPNNSMWFRRVRINDKEFNDDKDNYIQAKGKALERDSARGWSIDEDRKAKEYIKSIEDEDERESERKRMFGDDEYEKKERDIDTIKMMAPKTDANALRQIVKNLVAKKKKGIPPNAKFTDVEEGTCGYTPDGKPRSKPTSPVGKGNKIEENTRTRELADSYSLAELKERLAQIYREMEEEAEPEGGPVADQYADEIQRYEDAIRLKKNPFEKDSVGGMTYDQAIKRKYGKSPRGAGAGGPIFEDIDLIKMVLMKDEIANSKFGVDYDKLETREKEWVRNVYTEMSDTLLNESEKSWNAIDVSRTAEKELSNKEWNERTAKKLEMLMKLNAAGKFKKDFDEERLQGWVDQNYSWEKLSRQFKVNEDKGKLTRDEDLVSTFGKDWVEKFKPLKEKLKKIEKSLTETMKSSDRINREVS